MEDQRRGNAVSLLLVLCTLLFLMPRTTSAYMIYRVGDDDGWTINANGLDYSKWASQKAFQVGDMLVFEYSASNHTVIQTSNKEAFDSCNTDPDDAKIWSAAGSSSANVLLTTPGETYFLCTAWEGSHCRNGMKFGINVLGGGSSNGLMPPTGSPTVPSDSTTTSPAPISELTPGPIDTPGAASTTPAVITKPSSDSNSPGSSGARSKKLLDVAVVVVALAIVAGVQLVF